MYFPIAMAVKARAQQVVSIPLGVAGNVAGRGMFTNPVYNLRGRLGSMGMGLGVSSGAAGAGQSGEVHVY